MEGFFVYMKENSKSSELARSVHGRDMSFIRHLDRNSEVLSLFDRNGFSTNMLKHGKGREIVGPSREEDEKVVPGESLGMFVPVTPDEKVAVFDNGQVFSVGPRSTDERIDFRIETDQPKALEVDDMYISRDENDKVTTESAEAIVYNTGRSWEVTANSDRDKDKSDELYSKLERSLGATPHEKTEEEYRKYRVDRFKDKLESDTGEAAYKLYMRDLTTDDDIRTKPEVTGSSVGESTTEEGDTSEQFKNILSGNSNLGYNLGPKITDEHDVSTNGEDEDNPPTQAA
jgi:hypothetical protein